MKLKKGYIQVYTGDGKGKTTAAIGLAIRAAGAGLKVYIGQFIKRGIYSEIKILKKLGKFIKIEQLGSGCFIIKNPQEKDIVCAKKALAKMGKILSSSKYDLVILDEINTALCLKLIPLKNVLKIIKSKPQKTELILTGRRAPMEILKAADLITEMREIKHYYKSGVKSRCGIEC